jgi:hypothetical protein
MSWDSFASASKMIALGEQAALAAIPAIKKWLALELPENVPGLSPSTLPVALD